MDSPPDSVLMPSLTTVTTLLLSVSVQVLTLHIQECMIAIFFVDAGEAKTMFKKVTGSIGKGIIKGASAVAPLIEDGAKIAEAYKGAKRNDVDLYARDLEYVPICSNEILTTDPSINSEREDAIYE